MKCTAPLTTAEILACRLPCVKSQFPCQNFLSKRLIKALALAEDVSTVGPSMRSHHIRTEDVS